MKKQPTYNELQTMINEHLIKVAKVVSEHMDINDLRKLEKELRRYDYLCSQPQDKATGPDGPI